MFSIAILKLNAQENNQPKVGLCLSSGGAKGLAHIGLLKLIDSLGIKIDYITGCSMGSVVGGLYAAGYTGKQIDSIAHAADWTFLLNQNVPMDKIYLDEKDEYTRYIGELTFYRRKPQITGLIEGQELLNLLTRLTKHVNHISDFNHLPIPFKCMGSDIENISPVILDSGSLAIAMRASMAIPSIFKPVKIDDKLLVDGGLLVNFPVRQLKDMGADFIIGSYTGGRLMEAKEMNTVDKLLLQSSIFYGIVESKEDIALCNIFNNLTEDMTPFGAGDFAQADKIIEEGNALAYNVLPQLIKLAEKQKASGIAYQKPNLVQHENFFKVENIFVDTLYSEQMNKFIRHRITFEKGDSISTDDLEKTVKKIYATRMFFKTYYLLEPLQNGNYNVRIKVEQDNKFRIKGALHYDTELGSGFIFNVTARNWLGKGSRLFATVDLAESLKCRIHYRKYIAQSNLSFNAEFQRQKSPLEFEDVSKSASGIYWDFYRSFNTGFNYNIAIPVSIYFGAIGEKTKLMPKYNSDIDAYKPGNYYRTQYIKSDVYGFVGQFRYNTLNRFVFPNKGTEILIENKISLISLDSYADSIITVDTARDANFNYTQYRKLSSSAYLHSPYDRLFIKVANLLPVSRKISILSGINMGFNYMDVMKFDTSLIHIKYDYYAKKEVPLGDNFFNGGVEQRSRPNFIPLWGVKDGNAPFENFASARLGVQWEAFHKLFITPTVNYFYTSSSSHSSSYSYYSPDTSYSVDNYVITSSNPKYFFKNLTQTSLKRGYDYYYNSSSSTINYDEFGNIVSSSNSYSNTYYSSSAILTYGLNIGYKSLIGPINFNVSKMYSYNDKYWYKTLRFYFSIGYRF